MSANWTQDQIDARNKEVMPREPLADASNTTSQGRNQSITAPDVPEALIQSEVTKLLEEDGWRALRTDPVSDRMRGKGFGEVGMADYMYIRYTPMEGYFPTTRMHVVCSLLWIEFKRGRGGVLSKAQRDWHTKERARGALTLICGEDFESSVEGWKRWYSASGLQRER